MTREKKKSGVWDKSKKEVLVLRGTKDEIEPLFKKEMEIVKKIWERNRGFKSRLRFAKKLLSKFLDNSDFRKLIDKSFGQNNDLFLLQPEVLRGLVANLKKGNEVDKLESLVESLSELDRLYGARINLRKNENGNISIETGYGFPNFQYFKIKDSQIIAEESIEKVVGFFKNIFKFKCIYNEIEIQDETEGFSADKGSEVPLFGILSGASYVSPTIIKYEGAKGFKRMLISIPPDMDITTLTKKYGALISKAHRDFYKREFGGRPQSETVPMKRELIYKIWQEKFKGKKFPIFTRCIKTSEILERDYGIRLTPATLRRHYLREIKGEKRQ